MWKIHENSYPDYMSVSVLARPQAGPYVINHSVDDKTPCGRARLRHRRCHRRCFSLRPSNGLRFCTMNVQGLHWSKLSHRPNSQQLVTSLRTHGADVMFFD